MKVSMMALKELGDLGDKQIAEESGPDMLVAKCLALIENMVDLNAEYVSNKLMHADNLIDFLLLIQEREKS